MARIILSEAVKFGIKGTTKRKPKAGKKYQELVREADNSSSELQKRLKTVGQSICRV